MALIKLEGVRVTKHVGSNGAFAVEEYVTLPDGRSFPKSFTVWATGEPPAIDSAVNVTGLFSAKTRAYDAPSGQKVAIDVSINEPEVIVVSATPNTESAPF